MREFYEEEQRTMTHILAYNDSAEISDLYEYWEPRLTIFPGLERKLRCVFRKGPDLTEDENPSQSTNASRNHAFAYLLAGSLLAAGIDVTAVEGITRAGKPRASDADITFQWDGSFIEVECKRPQSAEAAPALTRKARAQITDRGHRGIIALDCSSFIRPPGEVLQSASGDSAEECIAGLLLHGLYPTLEPLLTSAILGFILFARVPLMTLLTESSGKPFETIRRDSLKSLVVVSNASAPGSDLLRSIHERFRSRPPVLVHD